MTVTLHIDSLTVTAEFENGTASVTSAKDANGQDIHVTPADLDAWEPALFEAFEDEALCAYWQMIEESDLGYERRFFC